MARDKLPFQWIRPLATPYLRGYRAKVERARGLRGFSFTTQPQRGKGTLGFFVGYLTESAPFAYLKPAPPECLAGAFIAPVGGALHRQLVTAPDSLFRGTSTYIGWLTHRRPRFVFSEDGRFALVRHASMREWPASKHHHLSRNFFIETLAWLVRSGLVKRLLALAPDSD